MKVGRTVRVVVSPDRRIRKANEPRQDPRVQPIPVEIPRKKKVKKEVEVDALDSFRYAYRLSWGMTIRHKNPILANVTS